MDCFTSPTVAARTAHGGSPAQAGFSLVELMIGITIALFLVFGLAVLFANTSTARGEVDRASRQIESGRYALQVLADEVRHAGYYGPLAYAPKLTGTTLPDPCSSDINVTRNGLGLALQGYDDAASVPSTCPLGSTAAGYKAGTAVLVVRRANTATAACAAPSYCIQVSGCAGAGDPVPYRLDAAAGTFDLHANTTPGCTPLATAPAAAITPFLARIYFISTCSGTDCSAVGHDSVPTLKRVDVTIAGTTVGTPITPIVDGIENLQFDFGIDNAASDGVPDVYMNTPSALGIADWQNVMSLRIYLLARNVDPTPGYTDTKVYALGAASFTPSASTTPPETSFRRHAYSELVRLNNPAGRRE